MTVLRGPCLSRGYIGQSDPVVDAALGADRQLQFHFLVDVDNDRDYDQEFEDFSPDVISYDLSVEISSEVPTQTKLTTGAASSDVSLTMNGGLPNKYAEWNQASPYANYDLTNSRCVLGMTLKIGDTWEWFPRVTGWVHTVEITAAATTITMVDGRAELEAEPRVPLVLSNHKTTAGTPRMPGLYGTWLVDYLLRWSSGGGFFAGPRHHGAFNSDNTKNMSRLSLTFRQSAAPEVGAIDRVQTIDVDGRAAPLWSYGDGRWGQCLVLNTRLGALNSGDGWTNLKECARYDLQGYVSTPGMGTDDVNTDNIFQPSSMQWRFRGWVTLDDLDQRQGLWTLRSGGANNDASLSFFVDTDGLLKIVLHAEAKPTSVVAQQVVATSVTMPVGKHVFVSMYVWRQSTKIAIDLNIDGVGGYVEFVANKDPDGADYPEWIKLLIGEARYNTTHTQGPSYTTQWAHFKGKIEAFECWVQYLDAYLTWTDQHTPTAYLDASKNRLDASRVQDGEDEWGTIIQICSAEGATFGFLPTGEALLQNRDTWTATRQKPLVLNSDFIYQAGYRKGRDSVLNQLTLRASPIQVTKNIDVWSLDRFFNMGPGQTRELKVVLDDGPITNIRLPIVWNGTASQSRYQANAYRDGTGPTTNEIEFVVLSRWYNELTLQITNPTDWIVALVDANGDPALTLHADRVLFRGESDLAPLDQTATDSAGVAARGVVVGTVIGGPFIQQLDDLGTNARELLTLVKDPRPVLDNLSVVADPQIILPRNVRISESETLGVDGLFTVYGLSESMSQDGNWKQSLKVRFRALGDKAVYDTAKYDMAYFGR